jgi:hypothetical protein
MSNPEFDSPAGWNANQEKLLALILVDDGRAKELSVLAGEAFFRAFIVEDRQSGRIRITFRFRYSDGHDSWFHVDPKEQNAATFRELREAITAVVMMATEQMGLSLSPLDVKCFQPPDDGGDWERTVQWLLENDLVHPPRVESIERQPS